jgi:hypothetical protein
MNELYERELQNISINDVSLADYVKENYVPIPDNATNGDMIKTIFDPETSLGIRLLCTHCWWNAPYQKGGKENSDADSD